MSDSEERLLFYALAAMVTFLTLGAMALTYWVLERRREERRRQETRRVQAQKDERQRELDNQRYLDQREREERRAKEELNARNAELSARYDAIAHEREMLAKEQDREERRFRAEEKARFEARKFEEDRRAAEASGLGSGGYIIVDLPEKERPFFHDLLKGFEDYATLQGYSIAFSIDSTYDARIGFKFTIKNEGFSVGAERVSQDFKDYLQHLRNGNVEKIDEIPVVRTIGEHKMMLTQFKNRFIFLQLCYDASLKTIQNYEQFFSNGRAFPALPAPNVVVHTGGSMDSRNYTATNSKHIIQGDSNRLTDSSVNIGGSFNERQERVAALDDVIAKLKDLETEDAVVSKAARELGKVRDELTEDSDPDKSSVKKWLGNAKNLMGTAALSFEVTEAAKKLWELFGS